MAETTFEVSIDTVKATKYVRNVKARAEALLEALNAGGPGDHEPRREWIVYNDPLTRSGDCLVLELSPCLRFLTIGVNHARGASGFELDKVRAVRALDALAIIGVSGVGFDTGDGLRLNVSEWRVEIICAMGLTRVRFGDDVFYRRSVKALCGEIIRMMVETEVESEGLEPEPEEPEPEEPELESWRVPSGRDGSEGALDFKMTKDAEVKRVGLTVSAGAGFEKISVVLSPRDFGTLRAAFMSEYPVHADIRGLLFDSLRVRSTVNHRTLFCAMKSHELRRSIGETLDEIGSILGLKPISTNDHEGEKG